MSIFDMFRGGANPNAVQKQAGTNDPLNPQNPNLPQNQQQTQQQQPAQPQPKVDANGNPLNPDGTPVQQQSPEVDYSKLWVNDPNNKGPADPAEFRFNVDQNKVNETFGQLDFTKSLTPDLLQKINGGGADAMSALLTAINVVGQQATKTAFMAATKVSETGIQNSGQRVKDYIPNLVREHTVSNALREDNPLMNQPQYAPMVEAVTLQMARQFPQATPDEIKNHTRKYFDEMTKTLVTHSGKEITERPQQASQARIQTDWSTEPI